MRQFILLGRHVIARKEDIRLACIRRDDAPTPPVYELVVYTMFAKQEIVMMRSSDDDVLAAHLAALLKELNNEPAPQYVVVGTKRAATASPAMDTEATMNMLQQAAAALKSTPAVSKG